ncbi:MAG TPA: glycosyltransferase [Chryseosolibacter sp.]|nr:glycosyltransferase [Chryseosolibacter sp.]
MSSPLVSVICLCYNQRDFVEEAIDSVLNQSYKNIELIVVDDASTDDSKKVINEIVQKNPTIRFLSLDTNLGNCKAFNKGLSLTKGDYVIDLAADDVLEQGRIQKGIDAFASHDKIFGVHFSDALWIDEAGAERWRHSSKYPHETIPQGDIYLDLITRFFICPPSMMFKREVIDELNGYDESLAYEDFDFWIRSSRKFHYCYSPVVLVKKRVVFNSLSSKQFQKNSNQLRSTYHVCRKILALNKNKAEQQALTKRIIYEISVCARLFAFGLTLAYAKLLAANLMKRYAS